MTDVSFTPPPSLGVIAVLPQIEGTLYRVVGPRPEGAIRDIQAAPPTLEDAYVWLLQKAKADAPVDEISTCVAG